MVAGLAVDDVVSVQVVLTPTPAQFRNFGTLLIAGPSDVIDQSERIRQYTSIQDIAADFGTTAPEYLAALIYFEQVQKPQFVNIGRWVKTATKAVLHGGLFNTTQQAGVLTSLQAITTGSVNFLINGTSRNITGLDFHLITNLNGAASIITTAINTLVPGAGCTWMPDSTPRFNFFSGTTGATSTISYGSTAGTGTDISALLKTTAATGAALPVSGAPVETPLVCATVLTGNLQQFNSYAFGFAQATFADIPDADHEAVASYIEALTPSHTYWLTDNDPNIMLSTSSTDLGAAMRSLGLNRSFLQYSSSSPYAAFAAFAKFAVIDPTANNSMITAKFKQETGVVAETISESQAATLKAKNVNVFVNYNNATAILQEGVMCSGQFADTMWGADLMQNRVQTSVNLLYTTPTKIPQTEAGIHRIQTTVEAELSFMVYNGSSAPGTWNNDGFGEFNPGQYLPKGFYVYTPPLAQQNQADRAARKAPVMQCAVKMAGAVHYASVIINVNP